MALIVAAFALLFDLQPKQYRRGHVKSHVFFVKTFVKFGKSMNHPFGDLVKKYLAQKPDLNQSALAARINQDDAVVSRMLNGERLANLNARQRVLDIIEVLISEKLLTHIDEANEILEVSGWSRLLDSREEDVKLINKLEITTLSIVPLEPLEGEIYPNNEHPQTLAIFIAVFVIGAIVIASVWMRPNSNSRDICEHPQITCLGDGWCRAQLSEVDIDSHSLYLERRVDLDVEHFVCFNDEF